MASQRTRTFIGDLGNSNNPACACKAFRGDVVQLTMQQPWGRTVRHFRLMAILDGPALDAKGRPVPTVIAVAAHVVR